MSTAGKLLIETITSPDPALRDRSVRELVAGVSLAEMLQACEELEQFRRHAREPLRAGPRLAVPARALPLRASRTPRRSAARA